MTWYNALAASSLARDPVERYAFEPAAGEHFVHWRHAGGPATLSATTSRLSISRTSGKAHAACSAARRSSHRLVQKEAVRSSANGAAGIGGTPGVPKPGTGDDWVPHRVQQPLAAPPVPVYLTRWRNRSFLTSGVLIFHTQPSMK